MRILCGGVRVFDGPVFAAHSGSSKTPTLPPIRRNRTLNAVVDKSLPQRNVASRPDERRTDWLPEIGGALLNSLFGGRSHYPYSFFHCAKGVYKMPQAQPLYPNGRPTIVTVTGWISALLLVTTLILAAVAWCLKCVVIVYILAALWGITQPLWFWYEYFYVYRVQGDIAEFEKFKYGQQISVAIWAGVTILLVAYSASDHFKNPAGLAQTSVANPPAQSVTGPTCVLTSQQWLAVLGAAAGSLGSIITAFSLNSVIRELNIARGFLEVTVEALASAQPNIPVFQGLEQRYHHASRWGNKVVWVGVALLVAGFVLQAFSICI